MSFVRSERKCIEILRILKDYQEPVGAKRLSEMMAARGFVLTDRAVQYYLSYLDDTGFTRKIGNRGRVLTKAGIAESENALVDERVGFVISKLEKLAFRSNFDPETCTGNVAYNLSFVPEEEAEGVTKAFDDVIRSDYGFFTSYKIIDSDPRIPKGHVGFITVCSVTMDGILQKNGIPVRMAFGGTMKVRDNRPMGFTELIGYRGTTVDPLMLFINSGMTSISETTQTGNGTMLANVREIPESSEVSVMSIAASMQKAGFRFPVTTGCGVMNVRPDPYRTSIIAYSGMNLIGCGIERGYNIKTEIGAGNISYSKFEFK
ncbi:DUF128 domain-containing protein [Methanoplanus endosymbiosus]|uniref:NrpR regulatory domain-containing protein n=1 Tax=Methanoplanus endosymbiosus TaxID=33865 RepID=A0A9E7TK82_9EURY|nr:NrpR regulatory domain-containing protein [Methanoplanus endosymbiosus]UUX92400.1 NrpR regulatory domain-containing protein [Methanoplanus endosymbiosus]